MRNKNKGDDGHTGDMHGKFGPVDRHVLDDHFSAAYEELRRLAFAVRRRERSVSLSPTALVNEAWLKLAKSPGIDFESPLHFKRIAARAMRQLLVEAARRRAASKRGGDEQLQFVTFDELVHRSPVSERELLALDAALDELAQAEPRQADMIECRFFGGFDVAEAAASLGVSEATVLRDWRTAKAWLAQALRNPE
jgi:RNA polymerase sigma factor (TIGR02999 family)